MQQIAKKCIDIYRVLTYYVYNITFLNQLNDQNLRQI